MYQTFNEVHVKRTQSLPAIIQSEEVQLSRTSIQIYQRELVSPYLTAGQAADRFLRAKTQGPIIENANKIIK